MFRVVVCLLLIIINFVQGGKTMEKTLHKAAERGYADHGWLKSYHSFSFAGYQNPAMMGFGLLRVINDDSIDAGTGFGTHPHRDMEIISIPLQGSLEHKDSMGNHFVIKRGEVQVMSAGSGITHSEYNHSQDEPAKFLQIWVHTKNKNITPSYAQASFDESTRKNKFQKIVSGQGEEGTLKINQDSSFSMANIDSEVEVEYKRNYQNNGIYVFVIEGEVEVLGEKLTKRDALGLSGVEDFKLKANERSEVLVIEVPLS
jgi:redox-sensitive bicupin YhaK (pirin superfamily)